MKPISNDMERKKIIQKRKQKNQISTVGQRMKKSTCYMCGREMKMDEYFWQADDDGMVCSDCLAERESCGCSD
jgi:hypothetical protein